MGAAVRPTIPVLPAPTFCYRVDDALLYGHLIHPGTVKVSGVVGAALTAAVACLAAPSVRRVRVVGASMAPALRPGDRLVVVGPSRLGRWAKGGPQVARGDVVAVRDPRAPGRVLVKRVAEVDRGSGAVTVLGDATGASTDSRDFGPVAGSLVVGRAVYRYAPPGRTGPGPWLGEYDPT